MHFNHENVFMRIPKDAGGNQNSGLKIVAINVGTISDVYHLAQVTALKVTFLQFTKKGT